MAAEVLASLAASVKIDGKRRTLRRGDQIPEGLDADDRARLTRRGSVVSSAELAAQTQRREEFKDAGSDPATALAGTQPEPVAEPEPETPEPETVSGLSDEALAEYVGAATVGELLEAVGSDAEQAQRVRDIEHALEGDGARKTLLEGLSEVIEAAETE